METISWIIGFISGIVVMASIIITIGILIKKLFTRDWYFTRSQRIFCVLAGFGILLLISPFII